MSNRAAAAALPRTWPTLSCAKGDSGNQSREPPAHNLSVTTHYSQKRSAKQEAGEGEIDDQPADVDDCRNERGRGAGGIESEAAKNEGEHGAGHGAKQNDADQAAADGQR